MKVLLRWGSAPDVACREPGDKAYTPLHRAALGGHGEAARVLIKAGADKDARTGGSGASPLHLSARKVPELPSFCTLITPPRGFWFLFGCVGASDQQSGRQDVKRVLHRKDGDTLLPVSRTPAVMRWFPSST